MCGIAGLALAPSAPPPDPALVGGLARALAHRGPDGAGHSVVGRVALVHTRLAIIDPEGGDQPLSAGSATLIGNGEIYNHVELRRELASEAEPPRFATGSDCEAPLHLWRRRGAADAGTLEGMYALAIHERATRQVTLTRDPFGIKPLYVAQLAPPHGPGLAFASEPRALLETGLGPRGARGAARAELLQMQFTTGADTIFPGIQRVLPGETLTITDGRVTERGRIAALPEGGPEEIGEDEALTRFDRAWLRSMELHLRSDVPYGLFLSGGIDSASVLAGMRKLGVAAPLAFTAGFAAPGAADEREAAARLARAAGARHERIEIDEAMLWRHLPEIVACMDDPAADYAIIPTWFLARRAARDVKVVLSGEGGDEIFAGYGRHRAAMRPWWLGGKVMRGRGAFDGLDVLRRPPTGWRDGLALAESAAGGGGRSRLMGAQALDCADWLPNDLLLKLDRCLMAHGVEGRTPFLHRAVAEAGFRLPDRLKARDGRGKWLLRRWLAREMPDADPFARKQGFTVPVHAWIAGAGARLGRLVAARPCVAEIAHPDRVRALFARAEPGAAAWRLLFYALWHRAHVEGLPMDRDVFEALG